jgi:F-type H+-transporting ATPase subunit delta
MAHYDANRFSPTALAYAQSLLELADEQKSADALGLELFDLRRIVQDNPSAQEILSNPAIGVEEREQILERIFRNNVSPLLFNALGVMNKHGRLGLIAEVATAYATLLEKQQGRVNVDMTVAQRLSPEQFEKAKQRISAALGREAIIRQHEDANIIGGVVLKVGDKLIDASVKYQLEAMKQQLLASAPK